jgi:hypothetical protein
MHDAELKGFRFRVSAQPLAAGASGFIGKETKRRMNIERPIPPKRETSNGKS